MSLMRTWVFAVFVVLFLSACAVEKAELPTERDLDVIPVQPEKEAMPQVKKETPPIPTTPVVPPPVSEIKQETMEKGGTLQEWKGRLQQETGQSSEESQTAAACEALMAKKIEECSKHPGWSVDNAMEITDFKTGQHYEFQDVKRQDCPGTSPTDPPPETIHVDTAFLDAQTDRTKSSSYQVVCSIGCNWWDCGTDLTGTWEGSYSETSSDAYCKYKESGTKICKITMKDDAFSGTAEYSGVSTITGGANCQGGTSSNTGTIEGTVSGKQVTGTIMYGNTKVPFTATVESATNAISGTYSYTTAEYGSPLSGAGEFSLKKK